MSVVLVKVLPSNASLPDAFRTPVIAFEFALSAGDIGFLMGNSRDAVAHRQRKRDGHTTGMLFPFAYPGFLALLLLQLTLTLKDALAKLRVFVALLILPFDINEN